MIGQSLPAPLTAATGQPHEGHAAPRTPAVTSPQAEPIITEAPDVLVPFNPIPSDAHVAALTTNPRPGASFDPFIAPPADLKVDGDVVLELCVSASGVVSDAKVLQSSGYKRLDQATIKQIRNARFEPATQNGKPVGICGHTLTMGWRLNAASP